jgi:hypothetical protein
MLAAAAASASASSPQPDDIGRLLACRGIAAQDARLRCFDRTAAVIARATKAARPAVAAAPVSTAPSPSGKPARTPAPTPAGRAAQRAAALNPQQTFGLSAAKILAREVTAGIRPKSITSISSRLVQLEAAPDGRMVYHLADGQIWEELQNNGYAPPVKIGDRVQISRGWLDSYWMQTPSGRGCKVQRLR